MIDFFKEVRERLDIGTVARHYGLEPTRNGYVRCLFHAERTASMKLYPGDGGYHCFGCGAHGSVIDLTAELLNLTPLDAVKRLNTDFCLGLNLGRKEFTPQERQQLLHRRENMNTIKEYENWKGRILLQLANAYCAGHLALNNKPPEEWTDAEALAIKWMSALEDWFFALDSSRTEQLAVFRDRKGVEQLCNRILMNKNLPKSATA